MENLYQHQRNFLDSNVNKCLLCWSTGTGKTKASIEWGNRKGGDTLVIVPKALKENWNRNVTARGNSGYIVLTKETFRSGWEIIPKYDNIIVDEAHYFAGTKSQMSKSLGKYIKKHKVQNILLLTATPYRSSPWDIYTLAKHLGYEWNWYKFFDKFFEEIYVGRGKKVPKVKEGIENEIASLVEKIGNVVHIDECADIPEQIFDIETFELTKAQETYKKTIQEISPIVRFTKYHQIESGILNGDEYTPPVLGIESNKADRIIELCNDNKKIIIVCRYNLQIDMLLERCKQTGKKVYIIRGDVNNRDEVIREADATSEAILLVQAACSEGWEAPSFRVMVFASMDFSYVSYKQMLGRILRLNHLAKNVYLHLICNGIDKAVYDSIMKKQDFSIAIYNKSMVESSNENKESIESEI
jgi:superfamily II DNA or RNA helicase